MTQLTVGLPGREYNILVGHDTLANLGTYLQPFSNHSAIAVVTDQNVWQYHGQAFTKATQQTGFTINPIVLAPGEHNKSLQGLEKLYAAFADMKLRRDGLVVAFGGGVIGDLAGFAAATYMRGVPYVQVPTTLLAQVDSSVGGKTAINLAEGKNLAGAFYQPKLVVIDTALLSTLPAREFSCGMAEVVKYGTICSVELFNKLTQPLNNANLPGVIAQCCQIKGDIVKRDEFDTGERMLLNFGHTFGHAVEALGGFERFNHGEAVAIGMLLAVAAGERWGITKKGCGNQLQQLLQLHHLPVTSPYHAAELFPQMQLDKKSGQGGIQLVLLQNIGKALICQKSFSELEFIMQEVA